MSSCFASTAIKKSNYFTNAELAALQHAALPGHIAIIPDGNRRWAKKHKVATLAGHRKGGETLLAIIKASKELGIKVLTCYCFSTENWARPVSEVQAFMWLFRNFLVDHRQEMIDQGIKLSTIGDLAPLPPYLLNALTETKAATSHCEEFDAIMALNYGSRNELCRATRAIANELMHGTLTHDQITEELIASYLDTAAWGDPDLLIRTSGERRLSNYLLWQLSYAEVHVSQTLWPDFTPHHLYEAVVDFQSRERRLGKS